MSRAVRAATVLGAYLVVVAGVASGPWAGETGHEAADAAYVAEVEQWRHERAERLAAPDGWLSLVGLYWLEPGANAVGTDAAAAVRFPADAVGGAADLGTLTVADGSVRFAPAAGSVSTVDGHAPVEALALLDDQAADGPTVVETGRLRWHVIRRGDRHGIRVSDPESPARRSFAGLEAFPVDPVWRVVATFRPFPEPREVRVPTVVGTEQVFWAPGRLEFEAAGERAALTPLVDEPGETAFFIMFRDATTGRETYGAGRYLSATLDGDTAILDFNRAYNPPCAFTTFATCPLPPPENRLAFKVPAGELRH